MGSLTDLPPHVWALVLRDATVHDLFVVAHTCRALHALIVSSDTCACARASTGERAEDRAHTRAYWAHWRDARPPLPLSAWHEHVRCGHAAHVALALRCSADPNAESQWAVRRASEHGQLAIVDHLLRDGRVGSTGHLYGALSLASQNGHLAVVARLLRHGVDPSARNQCAVRWASANGHVEVVNLLLRDARVDPSTDDQCALRMACDNGHAEVVDRFLCDARVDPSARDDEAIRWAACHGHAAVVERLMRDARVDPSAREQFALEWATLRGHVAVVTLLLRDERVGSDVRKLRECLAAARRRGHDRVVSLLSRHIGARCARAHFENERV